MSRVVTWWGHRNCIASRDSKLFDNQICPNQHLSDRMFDLNAGIHLDEKELSCEWVKDILDCASTAILYTFGKAHGAVMDCCALFTA